MNEGGNVVDLGAGHCEYVKWMRENGIDAIGFDGNKDTQKISKNLCKVLDLSSDINIEPRDWVLSLEVGEHIPSQYEETFINNLHKTNRKGIVLSWAIVGQGGDGHFNERSNKYIIDTITQLGYKYDDYSSKSLRDSATAGWFKNTVMVFRKNV